MVGPTAEREERGYHNSRVCTSLWHGYAIIGIVVRDRHGNCETPIPKGEAEKATLRDGSTGMVI
jgi:hypothetical protein